MRPRSRSWHTSISVWPVLLLLKLLGCTVVCNPNQSNYLTTTNYYRWYFKWIDDYCTTVRRRIRIIFTHGVVNIELANNDVAVAVCCLLFAVCCLLFAVCCLLFAVCCLLFAVCCLLFAVCCLLIFEFIRLFYSNLFEFIRTYSNIKFESCD